MTHLELLPLGIRHLGGRLYRFVAGHAVEGVQLSVVELTEWFVPLALSPDDILLVYRAALAQVTYWLADPPPELDDVGRISHWIDQHVIHDVLVNGRQAAFDCMFEQLETRILTYYG